MKSLTKVKEVQKLIDCVAALNQFVASATDRGAPFFKALKKEVDFPWTNKCDTMLQELRNYFGRVLLLSKPRYGNSCFNIGCF